MARLIREPSILLLLLTISLHLQVALGQLVVLSECICPGRDLRLECTVVGGLYTAWRGTAIDCPGRGNEILLPHSQFELGGVLGVCNNGIIIGRSLNRTFDGLNSTFTSQLVIQLPLLNDTRNTPDGRTVECTRDGVDVIDTYTVAYGRASHALPPSNVRLSQVSKNALTFQWDPVQLFCSYQINAEGCGVCPNTALNTSVTCVVNDMPANSNSVCTLSIETTVCGFQSDSSETATAILKAPDRPVIRKVLPYYSSSSNNLIKVDVQVEYDPDEERFNISDGISGSVTSYTFNIGVSYSESTYSLSTVTLPASSCVAGVCNATLTSLPCDMHPSQAEVAVYASNVLRDGLSSTASLNTLNSLFFFEFEPLSHTFSCRFVGRHENKSCEVTYGPAVDPTDQSCTLDNRNAIMNDSDSMISNTVNIFIPDMLAQQLYCFTAIGRTPMFTIAVEGTFTTGADNELTNETDTLSGTFITFTVLLAVLSTVLTVVIVLLARSRAKALNEVKLLRNSGRMKQNAAYEEIKLTPSDINTSENVAYGHISNR